MWCEGFSTVDDVIEVPLESSRARVHLDTATRRRNMYVVDVDVTVGDGQGGLKSVAGTSAESS